MSHADEAIVLDCGSQIFMRLGLQTGDDSAHSALPHMQALVQQLVQNRIPAPGLLRIDQVATIYSLLYAVYSVLSILNCLVSIVYLLIVYSQVATVLTCSLCDYVGAMDM